MKSVITAVHEKLKSRRGESLTEVLFALLVSSLGLLLMANMLNAAGQMVKDSKKTFEHYTEAENFLVDYGTPGSSAKVSSSDGVVKTYLSSDTGISSSGMRLTDSSETDTDGVTGKITVYYYKNNTYGSMPVISYKAG